MLMDWGAAWLSRQVPLPEGEVREVLLGCTTPADYPRQQAYLGASIRRYANSIDPARLQRNGPTYTLTPNQSQHQLHGGLDGFHARRWRIVQQDATQVTYLLVSPDGDQGYPGQVTAQARYRLTEHNALEIEYSALTEKTCPICLTNHAYFNLDGHTSDVCHHRLQLFADQKAVSGYDHAYLLHRTCGSSECPAANLWSADEKVMMSVFTRAPALQLYSGNFLAGTPAREGTLYDNFAGVALESEFLPDSPNHPDWPQPDCWLKPGKQYTAR